MYPSLTYCSNAHLIIDLLMWPFFSNEVAVFKLIEIAQKCTRVFCILDSNSNPVSDLPWVGWDPFRSCLVQDLHTEKIDVETIRNQSGSPRKVECDSMF